MSSTVQSVSKYTHETVPNQFVEVDGVRFAYRLFEAAKAQINRATLPPDGDLFTAYHEFVQTMQWPQLRQRLQRFGQATARIGVDEMEKNLGFYLGCKANKAGK